MIKSLVLSLLVLPASVGAYSSSSSARRAFFQQAATGTAAAAAMLSTSAPALALDSCPAKTSNCIRTTWTPPSGTSKANAAKAVQAVLQAYPQEGQADVDKGGWTIVSDSLAEDGTAKVEYKSGIGNFAKFFNGGKPFVDDLAIEISSDGSLVEIKSNSRVGDSDFDVNKKRLTYLGDALASQGWTIPEPKY